MPSLNEARAEFYAGTGDSQSEALRELGRLRANLKHPASLINFIAAYGTHATITSATTTSPTSATRRRALVLGGDGAPGRPARLPERHRRLRRQRRRSAASNDVDLWIGGLAEKKMPFGGMLGTTFNFVFEKQLENLQDGDRFYYLSRLANLNLTPSSRTTSSPS